MAQRITVYVPDNVLNEFDDIIGLTKRSTVITDLMKQEIKKRAATNDI